MEIGIMAGAAFLVVLAGASSDMGRWPPFCKLVPVATAGAAEATIALASSISPRSIRSGLPALLQSHRRNGIVDLIETGTASGTTPSSTSLPSRVASLGPIPAQVTLPIAYGKIERVSSSNGM